MKSMSTQETD